jgi:hypothetical protein
MRDDELRCCYCSQLLNEDDDAQRIDKNEYAHTACAFAADEAFFAALDAEKLVYTSNEYDN